MLKPVRLFQISVMIVGAGVIAWLLATTHKAPPSPPPPPPPPPVVVKPPPLDFPIAEASLVKLGELFGKADALDAFCRGQESLEPKLKFLHETSEVLMRHVAADVLPAGDSEPMISQLVVELGRCRTALWQIASKNATGGPSAREIPAGNLLKIVNRPIPRSNDGYSSSRIQEGPLTIVFPDGRRQAAYWNNNRLYEMETATAGDKKPATPQSLARERCLQLYDEITQALATWQDAKWVAVKKPRALTDICELFFQQRFNPTTSEDYQIQNENQNRMQQAFRRFFYEYYDSSQPLPELSWRVSPRLPEFFLPVIKGDPEAIKALNVNNYYWDSNSSMASLPRSETGLKIDKTCAWVRDYILACASTPQSPESQKVVDGLVKEMAARIQVPPVTWNDWVARQNLVAVLDHWRNMVWLGLVKPPELAQPFSVSRTWFEAVSEMMAGEPAWASSLLAAKGKSADLPSQWNWSNDSSEMAGQVALDKELLDRLEIAWGRQKPFIMPQRLCPPLHPFLQAGPLALKFEAAPAAAGEPANLSVVTVSRGRGRSMTYASDSLGDMLVPAKMWLDDNAVMILSQRFAQAARNRSSEDMLYRRQMVRVVDEAGMPERLLAMLVARYQNLPTSNPTDILQKENLRLKLLGLRSTCPNELRSQSGLANLSLPSESFLNQPEFKNAVMPQPDDLLRATLNQDYSAKVRQYEMLLGMDKEYFKTRCFTGPMDKEFISGLAAILHPGNVSSDSKMLKFQTAMLEVLDRSVMERAKAPALVPGDSQENFDRLVLTLLDAVAGSLNYNRNAQYSGYSGEYTGKVAILAQQIHQMLGRWHDAKDWTALKKSRYLRLLPGLEAFKPAPRNDNNYYSDSSRNRSPCFYEDLLFGIAGASASSRDKQLAQELQNMGSSEISGSIIKAMPNMVPDQEFVAMAEKLMTRQNETQEWELQRRQQLIGSLHTVILGKIAQEKLPDECTPADITRLVERMITSYQAGKGPGRSRLALALYTLQKAPWKAMPMPEKLKTLDVTPDLLAEIKKLQGL